MKEERRFIRAIIPGFLFIVELSIVLWVVLSRSQIKNIINYFRNGNTTALILVFIGSGGIGYFLAIIYRFFHWIFFQLGLSRILEDFLSLKILDLRVRNNKWNSKYIYFKRCGAWRIINTIFYARIKDSKYISGAQERNDRLYDNMHSSGTSFLGFIIAIIIGLIIIIYNYLPFFSSRRILLLLLLLFLFIVHFLEHIIARKNAKYFLKQILINDLCNYKNKENKALEIYIVKEDLNEGKFWHDLYRLFNKIGKRSMLKIDNSGKISLK